MKKIILGALAHVDAGKTSLSEALLHKTGAINRLGRVDHQDAFLDFNKEEKERGITIYNKEARFRYNDREYIYVDTPGHNEFNRERDRVLNILDVAIIIISAAEDVQSDTVKAFLSLQNLNIPVIFFVNKMDITHKDRKEIVSDLKKRFSENVVDANDLYESVALNSEELLDDYLSSGSVPKEKIYEALECHQTYPCLFGSALKEEGIDELLSFLDENIEYKEPSDSFSAYVYKITSFNNERLTHLKVESGSLLNKTSFNSEKINEILVFSGNSYASVQEVNGRDLCACKGLKSIEIGTYIPSLKNDRNALTHSLRYKLLTDKDAFEVFREIETLNSEFPELNITFNKSDSSVYLNLEGQLHSEIVKKMLMERFGLEVSFSTPVISYRETIKNEVYGVGHFEPLRHYAEVIVKLSPGKGYKVNSLIENSYINSLLSFLNSYHPKGILTNSELTDIEITIVDIKTHIKHTEGQDLFEALKRAIRQGLTKTESLLLEPYYLVTFDISQETLNRMLPELTSRNLTYSIEEDSLIVKIPEISFNDVILSLKERLKGSVSFSIEEMIYDECHNAEEVIRDINYTYYTDLSNPSGSIFTKNGAGHYVSAEEVEANMHLSMSDYVFEEKASMVHNKTRINEEELKRVWNSIYKPKERIIQRKNRTSEEREYHDTPSKPLMYLIDGYNLMFSSDELNEIAKSDFMNAREKTIDLVQDFAGYVSAECVLIFDAYKTDIQVARVLKRDNITIVYTKSREIADTYIEKKAAELKDDYKLIVVTSDRLEQLKVFSSSSNRLSSREFLMRYENMRKTSSKLNSRFNYRPLSELRELLLEDEDEEQKK